MQLSSIFLITNKMYYNNVCMKNKGILLDTKELGELELFMISYPQIVCCGWAV